MSLSSENMDTKWATTLGSLFKELGIPMIVVLFVMWFFVNKGKPEQHEEFCDRFILLKGIDTNPFPFFAVVILLVLVVFFQHYFFRLRLELLREENKRLGKEKSEWQERCLQKKLHSSE